MQANSVIIGRDILVRDDVRFIKEKGSFRIEKIPVDESLSIVLSQDTNQYYQRRSMWTVDPKNVGWWR